MEYNLSPYFSIVTVVFNAESFIKDTIESCLNQTFTDKEYIVINGGSTDNTNNIIQQYRSKIHVYLNEPDDGIYFAMNKGIGLATGKWIIFMNAGDVFAHNNVLNHIHQILEENQHTDILLGNTLYKLRNLYLLSKVLPLDRVNEEMIACHQSTFVKTEIMKKNLFNTKYKYAADYDCIYQLYKKGHIFKITDEIISIFDQNEGATLRNVISSTKERFTINKDRSKFASLFLTYRYIFRYRITSFFKTILPKKINDYILFKKNASKVVKSVIA